MTDAKPFAQGKTKAIFPVEGDPKLVRIKSLDVLSRLDGANRAKCEGKSVAANKTACNLFTFLKNAGIKSHFIRQLSDNEFEARRCKMVPLEWVARRIATGSFLDRNPGVKEGYHFTIPHIESFFKDDANCDPLWSEAQVVAAKFELNGRVIGKREYRQMSRTTSAIYRLFERAWRIHDCVLIDIKMEFGVTVDGELVLADVIDNDGWRLWPKGDRRMQLDRQVFRDLPEVTDDALKGVLRNYDHVRELTNSFVADVTKPRAIMVLGSSADLPTAQKIAENLKKYAIAPTIRICSAHKSTAEALDIVTEYEGDATPTVFIAIAGRSNGLGPVMAANTVLPVINAPPVTAEWGAQDVWSSLRMPSGVGCTTVLGVDEAALAAAKILSNSDYRVFASLIGASLNNVIKLLDDDRKQLAQDAAATENKSKSS